MFRATTLFFALLLVPAAAECAAAQASAARAAGSAAAMPAQSPQARRARVFTGLDIRFAVSVSPDGRDTRAYPVVRSVAPDSPGQQAGILPGDVITEVNGRDSREDRVLWLEPGVQYVLRIRTGDQEREAVIVPLPPRAPASTPAS